MRSVSFSAPGKLMLFGEYAVLHGSGCIVTAVDQRMKALVELTDTPIFELQAPDVDINYYKKPLSEVGTGDILKGAQFVEVAVKNFFNLTKPKGTKITTTSEFSSEFGFGSSSAVTVCVLKALSVLFDIKLTNKELFDLAYKTVLDVQKKGSGFDIAAAIYGGTLYFVIGGEIIEPLKIHSIPLIIGYSGIKADTVTIMNQVLEKTKREKDLVKDIYNDIAKIVEEAKDAIEKEDWQIAGELMNRNQELLKDLGVSTKKLDNMISSAIETGAYGAKLSGAGGGDCMIALCSNEKRKNVADAIAKAGGQVIVVEANAEGVRIEV